MGKEIFVEVTGLPYLGLDHWLIHLGLDMKEAPKK